jgi:cell division septum initiation protein DivIVA
MSRIIQLIDDIEDFFEQCNTLPFTNKVVVDKEDLYELMTELRLKVPDEIKKAGRLLDEKNKIISEAKELAEAIEKEAEVKIHELVNDHEIIQQAYAQAQAIIDQAKEDANMMRLSAIDYVDEKLEMLEQVTDKALSTAQNHYATFINTLSSDLATIKENRSELKTSQNEEE